MKRKIIQINEEKCNGCGQCIPNCPEGALQIIDGKARLVSELFCDGLGECMGYCPRGAISVEKREAEPYDEKRVMINIVKAGPNTIKAHLNHLKSHGEMELYNQAIEVLCEKNIVIPSIDEEEKLACGCPGTAAREIDPEEVEHGCECQSQSSSQLRQWPVQLKLINPYATYLDDADILIAADCCAYAYGNFHQNFIKNKVAIILCPKLDTGIEQYIEKLGLIFRNHEIRSISIVRMEVPCCGGLEKIVETTLQKTGKISMVKIDIISVTGKIL